MLRATDLQWLFGNGRQCSRVHLDVAKCGDSQGQSWTDWQETVCIPRRPSDKMSKPALRCHIWCVSRDTLGRQSRPADGDKRQFHEVVVFSIPFQNIGWAQTSKLMGFQQGPGRAQVAQSRKWKEKGREEALGGEEAWGNIGRTNHWPAKWGDVESGYRRSRRRSHRTNFVIGI